MGANIATSFIASYMYPIFKHFAPAGGCVENSSRERFWLPWRQMFPVVMGHGEHNTLFVFLRSQTNMQGLSKELRSGRNPTCEDSLWQDQY